MASIIGSGHRLAAGLMGSALLAAVALANTDARTGFLPAERHDAQQHPHPDDNPDVRRSLGHYGVPNVTMVRDDGKRVRLPDELDDGRPVMLNFVYTSCTTICPMSSQVFEQVQEALGNGRGAVHLMSISIDPEQDTPARLRVYARQFHAARGWDHYSATAAVSVAVQRAFDAYRGDKMGHVPLTLLRASPDQPWVRLDGFARAEDLLAEREQWTNAQAPLASR